MSRRLSSVCVALAIVAAASTSARAHCQIPCGIYDDPTRFKQLEEHVATIEKSMKQIAELSGEKNPNYNQIVRWVVNKETHADKLTEIVTFYFMAQRVKPPKEGDKAAAAKYTHELKLLHAMIVHAMKAKQTTDLEHCVKLRDLISQFQASYLGKQAAHQGHEHSHTHATGGEQHSHGS